LLEIYVWIAMGGSDGRIHLLPVLSKGTAGDGDAPSAAQLFKGVDVGLAR
jgi:hypothetical protein